MKTPLYRRIHRIYVWHGAPPNWRCIAGSRNATIAQRIRASLQKRGFKTKIHSEKVRIRKRLMPETRK